MRKGYGSYWRRLSGAVKAFLILVALYALLHFTRIATTLEPLVGLAAFLCGLVVLFRLARLGMRRAIWRLRNRLILAYVFIAVVPVVLIVLLVGIAGYVVIGQMAIYLVNTELTHRENALMRSAEGIARVPVHDAETALNRFAMMTHHNFPNFELRVTGREDLRYPADATLEQPPAGWPHTEGLVIKGGRLYAWAHVTDTRGSEVTVAAPITHELLAELLPGLGDINFVPIMGHETTVSQVPPPVNPFDMELSGIYPVLVPYWDSPRQETKLYLLVTTRISAVLGTVFGQKMDWAQVALGFFVGVAILFLLVELLSLVAGIQITRTITGAVHELYEGTRRIREGDFAYRIPVKGVDQLAELSASFNTMTENLGRLIIVAKEKERLESELAIAREVQNQLFPKDVPFTTTLALKGVCQPARSVSGDYYDFMLLSEGALAFAIGDVAGKGISAALLMASIQSTMRTQLNSGNGTHPVSTARLVSTLNRQLYATTAPEKYATFYFAVYEEATNRLTYTNAGHLGPILLHEGSLETLESTGTVVGAFPSARYEERSVRLVQGDILVAYTDGITEPENAYGEMFGEERLKDMLIKYANEDSSEIIGRTMEAVVQWTGSSELQDDMTMVVARRL